MKRNLLKVTVAAILLLSTLLVNTGYSSFFGSTTSEAVSAQGQSKQLKGAGMYLNLKGQKTGSVGTDIKVISFSHEIVSPRDAASGLPTGKRQHKPLEITKQLDKTSPMLMNMLCSNENITQFDLRFYDASLKNYYSIKLTNASIAKIELVNDSTTNNTPIEKISFCYQKIEWTWTDGGITAMDEWAAPSM